MLRLRRVSPNYRELFVARYDQLLAWALQLTQGDRGLAEDLLHDLYVVFTIHEPQIDPAQNVDGYLYTCLRNLYLSQIRRTARSRFQQLSIIEYESAKTGLRVIDPRGQIEVQDELRRICQYACARKDSSRVGSVLILRFFHGYYPSEIMRVLRSSRKAVDDRLRIARAEARKYLEDPQALSFFGGLNLPEIFPANFARTSADLLGELRQMIFGSRPGQCLANDHLRSFYQVNEATAMDCAELAHLVSCAVCLDEVNRMLKLPPLSQRYLSDTSGKDPGGHGGDGGSTSGDEPPRSLLKSRKARRLIKSGPLDGWDDDAREAFEHKPQELCVAVNGYLLGSQKVGQEQNELTLSLNTEEKPSFIEVFSEQGIRLSLMSVGDPPPEGTGEQYLLLKLSDARALGLTLQFTSPFLTLHVTYTDPALKGAETLEPEVLSDTPVLPSPAESQRRRVKVSEPRAVATGSSASPAESPRGRVKDQTKQTRLSSLVQRLRARLFTLRFWLRPATVTALFALALIVSLLLYLRAPAPLPTASDLLSRSMVAEQAAAHQTNTVLHRTISLEVSVAGADRGPRAGSPRGGEDATGLPRLLERRRIEIWQSADRGITARRLYNEQGQLVAGDWRRQDGVQALYQHGARPQLQLGQEQNQRSEVRGQKSVIRNFDEVWLFDLAAKDFSSLIGTTDQAHVEDRGNVYVISIGTASGSDRVSAPSANTSDVSSVVNSSSSRRDGMKVAQGFNPGIASNNNSQPRRGDRMSSLNTTQTATLLKATLTLSKADLHPVELTLALRGDNETREYRFIETNYERRAPNGVAPSVFEPEPELLGDTGTREKGDTGNLSASPRLPVTASPVSATAELEVEVLRLLNQAGADMGEQVNLTRTPGGRLRLEGIVETSERKAEIMRTLAPVVGNPSLTISVITTEEALKQQARNPGPQTSNSPIMERIESAKASPVDAELRRYFSGRGWSDDQVEANIYRFASRMVGHSSSALQHAWALKRLATRFSPDELRGLSPDTRDKWMKMMATHARALAQETAALRQELAPIFFPGPASVDAPAEFEIRRDEDLVRASTRLVDLCTSHHNLIRTAFAVSSTSVSAAALRDAQFPRSLRSAEKLAAEIGSSREIKK